MKKLLLAGAAAASMFGMTGTANAATCAFNGPVQECFIIAGVDPEFTVTNNPDGTISATIGRNGIGNYAFIDRYFFIVDENGLGSGSVSTTASGTATDLDFTDVDVRTGGTFVPGAPPGVGTVVGGVNYDVPINGQFTAFETAGAVGIPITQLQENFIIISGVSRGNGSYGGNVTFTPTGGVPEPATWAMMLIGFGAIGFGMRRRRKETARVRFAF